MVLGGQLRAWRGKKRSMLVLGWVKRLVGILIAASRRFVAAGDVRWHVALAFGVTAMAGIALLATLLISSRRGGRLKSPWSPRKRKHPLSFQQWNTFFTLDDGRLHDGGAKLLKKIRSGGIDPRIRAEVWPFLLGVYSLNSSEKERKATRTLKMKEYKKLRRQCQKLLTHNKGGQELKRYGEISSMGSPRFDESPTRYDEDPEFPGYCNIFSNRESSSVDHASPEDDINLRVCGEISRSRLSTTGEHQSGITRVDESSGDAESSDSESSFENKPGSRPISFALEGSMETDLRYCQTGGSPKGDVNRPIRKSEDFATWQRIIRLDAIRANAEWVAYSPAQGSVSKDKACRSAVAVGLKDYSHLEAYQIYHAARLVAVLEAYAAYDPEIGYCQGMSDLLSPILAVVEEEDMAFWCFVSFMRKARHNFRLDELGIRRQLSIVSKIIRCKDSHLYKHLEKLEAEDCFFVYRMVVVLFRRELTFEQTLCLWEVMWADQAAIRAGVGKSSRGRGRRRIRLIGAGGAPPTDELLLYAVAACVLQRRKLIIERYNSMDEIMRECNSMAGQLDVWKLLDDAHDLVVTLRDKIE